MDRMIAALAALAALAGCPPARSAPGDAPAPVAAEVQAVRLPDGGFMPWRPGPSQP